MTTKDYKPNFLKQVKYNGTAYTLVGYKHEYIPRLRKAVQSVILLEKNKNSTITVPIERVETNEG